MTQKRAVRYWLVVHARATDAIDVAERHQRFFEVIRPLGAPWGGIPGEVPATPAFGRNVNATANITKALGGPVRRATLSYPFRRLLTDTASCDDVLSIVFDPTKADLASLVYDVIPVYVEALDAYLVEYFDEANIDLAAEAGRLRPCNPRSMVCQVGLVNFWDEELCRRALRLSPTEVVNRVLANVEHAAVVRAGAFVVVSSKVLTPEESWKAGTALRSILGI